MNLLKRLYSLTTTYVFHFVALAVGSCIAAFAIQKFLAPNMILDGGVVGICIIIEALTKLPLSVLTWVMNIPFLLFGAKKKGKIFVTKSIYSMTVFSLALEFFKGAEVTDEHLLAVTFGGLILGIGVGLVLKFGGCLDGTEIIAMVISPKLHVTIGNIILTFNIFIYGSAGFLFGIDRTLFSILTYIIVSFIMTEVQNGFEHEKGVMIFTTTDNAETIRTRIYNELGRTCTQWSGEGYVTGKGKKILYCVISKFELNQLRSICESNASFVAVTDVSEIIGYHMKSKTEDERIYKPMSTNINIEDQMKF